MTPLMELRHLRYLVGIVDAGGFTRAAARLRVAQPALSRQLRDLEEEVGAPLLERRSGGVTPTAAGQVLVDEARALLARVDAALAATRAAAAAEGGEVRLGYAPSPTVELLPELMRRMAEAAPRLRVSLHDLSGDELLAGLREGKLDLVLMVDPASLKPRGVEFTPLRAYPHRVLVARDHRFARLARVPLAELAEEPLVIYRRDQYAEYFKTVRALLGPATRAPRVAAECDGATSLLAAVAGGRGVALVPSVFAHLAGPKLRLRPLSPEPAPLVVGYARAARRAAPPAARRCAEVLAGMAAMPD